METMRESPIVGKPIALIARTNAMIYFMFSLKIEELPNLALQSDDHLGRCAPEPDRYNELASRMTHGPPGSIRTSH